MNTFSKYISAIFFLLFLRSTAAPLVSFTVSKDSVCAGDTIQFNNTTTGGISYYWDFGDFTQTISTFHAKYAYPNGGSYTVRLISYDALGFPDTAFATVFVKQRPLPNFFINKPSACPGEPVKISNYTSGFDSLRWNFGDGTFSKDSATSIWHSYNLQGPKTIKQYAYLKGCKDSMISSNIFINTNKTASIAGNTSVSETIACPGSKISFQLYDADSSIKSILWRFTAKDSSTKEITEHAFLAKGTYPVTVKAKNYCNSADSTMYNILIADTIKPHLTTGDFGFLDPQRPYPPLLDSIAVCPGDSFGIHFLNSSYPNMKVKWYFGDGKTDTNAVTRHAYSAIVVYKVKLVITNDCGNKDSAYVKVNVTNSVPAVLDPNDYFLFDTVVCPNSLVSFTLFNPEKYATRTLKFGDGTTTNKESETHSYPTQGTYTVTLIISNKCGNKDSLSRRVHVVDTLQPKIYPYDYGAFNPLSPYETMDTICPGKEIDFYAYDYYYPEYSFSWYFGDGGSFMGPATKHKYLAKGNYTASLLFKNRCGNTDTAFIKILVIDTLTPSPKIITSTDSLCFKDNIHLEAQGGESFSWNMGDGSPVKTTQMISHTYTTTGTYTITLTVKNQCGKPGTSQKIVKVTNSSKPVFSASASLQEVCPGDTVQFFPSENNFAAYLWKFGDGTSSNLKSPKKVYTTIGHYSPMLYATNACNKTDSSNIDRELSGIKVSNTTRPYSYIETYASTCAYNPMQFFSKSKSSQFHTDSSAVNNTLTYLWKFGDNTTSALKNPAHTYKAAGTYTVMLRVINLCGNKDSSYKEVTVSGPAIIKGTATYSGGLVNSGKAYAYEIDSVPGKDLIKGVSTLTAGKYTFDTLATGNYIIKIVADTMAYPTLEPSYGDSSYFWDSARVITNSCGNTVTMNIKMSEPTSQKQIGTVIRGFIGKDVGFLGRGMMAPGEPIPDIDVKLGKKPKGEFTAETRTSKTTTFPYPYPNFEFNDVPFGEYIVYVDIPGLGLVSHYEIKLDANNDTIIELEYWVDSTKIDTIKNNTVSVYEFSGIRSGKMGIHPNPFQDYSTITITVDENQSDVKLEVYNLLGEKLAVLNDSKMPSGNHAIKVKKGDFLIPGIYLIKCSINGKTYNAKICMSD